MLVSAGEGYRIWAPEYDAAPNPLLALEFRLLSKRLGPLAGSRFLDVGTGTGRWMKYAAARGAKVFGIDISMHMLAVAARDISLVGRLAAADMRRLPFAPDSADFALCSFALGYVGAIDEIMRELARVARCVIVSDLHPAALHPAALHPTALHPTALHPTARAQGWTRSFRAGKQAYEIAHFPHSAAELDQAAHEAGLRPQWQLEAALGEPERELFEAAGRPELYRSARGVPAVRAVCWSRDAE